MYIKALERGLSCMPVNVRTGAALIENWQRFSFEYPSEEECELWERLYPIGDNFGIALVCGRASGIEAVDIDTDDENAHKLIPISPYGKRGLPGRATYFFKWNEKHHNIAEGAKKVGLYHTGKYHILPPSKHRKFDGTYTVLNKSIFDLDRDELPDLHSLDFFDKLPEATSSEFNKSEGRNNFLVKAITAMRADGKSEEEIVNWIYEWDFKNHKPRLFTDPNETYKAKDEDEAYTCAHKMVINVTKTLLSKRLPVTMPSKRKNVELLFDIDTFSTRALPMPSNGMLRLFSETANASSRFDVTNLSLGGALSFVAALISNRIKLNNTWPNLYILGLATSGFGKGATVDLLKNVLSGTNLIGADMYRSSQAFVQELPQQQQRLDVIDEAAPFFESMKSSVNYTSDLVDVVNRIFSLGPTRFDGISSVKHGKRAGASFNPCVSIYATVHQQGFLKSVQGYLGSSGLLPRFMIFEQDKIIKNKNMLTDVDRNNATKLLKDFVRRIGSMYPYIKDDSFLFDAENPSRPMLPRELTMSQKARAELLKYDEHTTDKLIKNQASETAPYIARLYELVTKVTMISTVAMERDFVEIEDVEFAISLVETLYHNSQLIRHSVTNSGRISGPWSRIENILRKHGRVVYWELQRKTEIPKRELDPLLDTMTDAGVIVMENVPTKTKPRKEYYLAKRESNFIE